MKALHMISFILLIVGGVNWLLIGLGGFMGGDWNVVHMLLGSMMWLESLVYVLVGLSAVYLVFTHKQTCRYCGGGMGMGGGGMGM